MEEENKEVCPDCGYIHEEYKDEDSLLALSAMTADSFVNEVFPRFWNDAKTEVKDLSKKEGD